MQLVVALNRLPANLRGALWLVAGSLIFTGVGIFIRLASLHLDSMQISFFRSAFGLIFVLPVLWQRRLNPLATGRLWEHFNRAVMGTAAMVCGFYAVSHLLLADATAISFSQALFVTVIAAVLLRETVRWRRWTATLVGFVGVIIMMHPGPGSLQIAEVAAKIASHHANQTLLVFGLVFVVAGLGFKLGAVPFHMWLPDVYHGAPTAVTLLIGSAPELATFAFVLRILVAALGGQTLLVEWQQMLILLAVLSMAIGNVTAIAQTNIKRMLAYSTISHMGFMLLGILSGSINGYSAAMFYIVTYVLTVAAAFAVIMLLSREGFEAEQLDDFKGLNQRNPWYAFVMLLVMFSLAGIPPAVGFYAKLSVFQAVIDKGMLWLAVVAVLFSLIGAFYYLRVVKLMYFDAPQDDAPLASTADVRALITANGLAVLVLGLLPGGLMELCQRAIQGSL